MNLDNTNCYNSAGLLMNFNTGEVSTLGIKRRLSPVNSRVLLVLLQHAENAVSRQQLFEQVWPNQVISDDALTRSISDLRSQLKTLSTADSLIETIPKVGYRWLSKVAVVPDDTLNFTTDLPSFWSKHLKPMLMALVIITTLLWGLLSWFYLSSQTTAMSVLFSPQNPSKFLSVLI